MVTNLTKQELNELFGSADFQNKLKTAGDVESVKRIFKESGVELTDEEMQQIVRHAGAGERSEQEGGALSDAELKNVGGGLVFWLGEEAGTWIVNLGPLTGEKML